MTHLVSSYTVGEWTTPASDHGAREIRDASTGAVVAAVGDPGLDFAKVAEHARSAGGAALRSMTFHQRALALKKLTAYLKEHTETLYADYLTTGATMPDARVDVEGGIQALGQYASKGLKELPNDTVIIEGTPEYLADQHQGQVVLTSRHGVFVQINAFNFPVWAFLEKLGPAVLAGLPTIVKPATPTAHVAETLARLVVESGALPEGAVQFVGGSIGDLFDHLGGQDHIAFTGSAGTAALLRRHPAVVERSARFNAEADSLNATILGPDAVAGQEELDYFVKSALRELTSKTGQKCTAIRRVFVPQGRVDEVAGMLVAKLARVVVGDPRVEGTTMGPLVSVEQRDDVADAVRRIVESGAEVVLGGPDAVTSANGADPETGAFFAPTVLRATDPRATGVHTVEAFGPVATLVPYAGVEDLVSLVALGEGSLAASVVSNDPEFVREVALGVAPFHGKVVVFNRANAATAAPHGAALGKLIHGGPGRAGGGEELGGIRAVKHLMQATSIAGSPDMIVAVTRSWNPAATAHASAVHPFRLYLEDLELGDTLFTGSRTITLEDIEHFAHFTGDTFYAHMNEEAAKDSPLFKGRVAHGYFILACAAGLFVDPDPGPVLANYGLENLRFVQPMYPGDTMTVRLTAKEKTVRAGTGWGEVVWDVAVTNQRDELTATYQLLTINACRPTEAG
ncbi:MAG TPA: phenylacetic acid degradation bifunctional protein PaaZ [Dermatophilaceae bacterium]|nr:phenylacetic acid degradation bifunctional protein PaaZ [Dermatophilaceae bacterium]